MRADDLAMVLAWRNSDSVRRYMRTRHVISTDEHRRWFENESTQPDRHLLILELDAVPSGFISFTIVGDGGIADWGFYTAPGAAVGTGRLLARVGLDHAFGRLKLHKICGQALASNQRSIRFHERQGFTREGVLRQQHFDGHAYEDLICFGLIADEWMAREDIKGTGQRA